MKLPTAREINPNAADVDFDGGHAERHFLGKTLEEAEALFRENSIYYQEDLMWMGPVGFRFYVRAAINYLRSDAATGDSGMVHAFVGLLGFWLEFHPKELVPVAAELAAACASLRAEYDRFDVAPEIYGDLRPRLQSLEESLRR